MRFLPLRFFADGLLEIPDIGIQAIKKVRRHRVCDKCVRLRSGVCKGINNDKVRNA